MKPVRLAVFAVLADRAVLAAFATVAALVLTGCAATAAPAPSETPSSPAPSKTSTPGSTAGISLPPAGGVPDYQLGTAYPPDERVEIVVRDRTADPAEGRYSVCYVNGFQTQPGELDTWPENLLLRTDEGEPFIDPDWPDEVILDTRTAANRDAIAGIVGAWIEGCAASGYHAVEFDNLDTFTRTGGALSLDDNLALASSLVEVAHGAGLAAGQKNAAEFAALLRADAGFDFAVTEECAAYEECSAYTDVYGAAVIDIEYTDELPRPFDEMCADEASPRSMVLRDRELASPGDDEYAFELC